MLAITLTAIAELAHFVDTTTQHTTTLCATTIRPITPGLVAPTTSIVPTAVNTLALV